MKNLGRPALFKLCVLLLAFAAAALDRHSLFAASDPVPPATEASVSSGEPTNSRPTRLSRVKSSTAPSKADVPGAFAKAAPTSINDLKAIERHVKTLMPRLTPAVVAFEVGGATGSGVVISEDGVVLTAAHVSDEPNRDVRFTFPDGKTARGKTLGTNHELDAGMARITDPGPWPHLPIGDLKGARLGDWVLTLGHPGGYEKERPIVVRLGRIIRLNADLVQTDCTVTAGDSGGPLVDMHGKVIGIHSRISDSTSENYHVPISAYSDSWDRLAKGENWGGSQPPSRSWVGARGVDHPNGCKLEIVEEDSPAAKAGLKAGDIIRSVNEQEVKDYAAFRRFVGESKAGDELKFSVQRDDTEISVNVKVEAPRRGR